MSLVGQVQTNAPQQTAPPFDPPTSGKPRQPGSLATGPAIGSPDQRGRSRSVSLSLSLRRAWQVCHNRSRSEPSSRAQLGLAYPRRVSASLRRGNANVADRRSIFRHRSYSAAVPEIAPSRRLTWTTLRPSRRRVRRDTALKSHRRPHAVLAVVKMSVPQPVLPASQSYPATVPAAAP